jgi:sulfite reductase beta subunit-like hemoprotein
MPYTSAKADAVIGLRPDTVRAMFMYLVRDWSLEQLEELIEATVWHPERDALRDEWLNY